MKDPAPPDPELPQELYLNIHVRLDLGGGRDQVTAQVAVDAQGSPVADENVARELLHTVLPALVQHAARAPSALAQRTSPAVADGPLGVEPDSPRETVRITLLWTGDPNALDAALCVAAVALERCARGRALLDVAAEALVDPTEAHAEEAAALASQIFAGALGDDDDEAQEELHPHLGVVRWERTPTTDYVRQRWPADGGGDGGTP